MVILNLLVYLQGPISVKLFEKLAFTYSNLLLKHDKAWCETKVASPKETAKKETQIQKKERDKSPSAREAKEESKASGLEEARPKKNPKTKTADAHTFDEITAVYAQEMLETFHATLDQVLSEYREFINFSLVSGWDSAESA